jgi:competence protein ComEC
VVSQLGSYMPFNDREIELLIVTHNHADHIGGMQSILNSYKVDRIWLSGAIHTTDQYINMLKTIKEKQIPVTIVKAGDKTDIGETTVTVLHPAQDATGTDPQDQHEATVVTKFAYKDFCGIMTGDLNANQEHDTLGAAKSLNVSVRCDFLKVSHHGSAYGSSQELLDAVQPKVAAISVGAHNVYHHPAPSTVDRLTAAGIKVYRTDQNGTITISSDGQQFWTKTEK